VLLTRNTAWTIGLTPRAYYLLLKYFFISPSSFSSKSLVPTLFSLLALSCRIQVLKHLVLLLAQGGGSGRLEKHGSGGREGKEGQGSDAQGGEEGHGLHGCLGGGGGEVGCVGEGREEGVRRGAYRHSEERGSVSRLDLPGVQRAHPPHPPTRPAHTLKACPSPYHHHDRDYKAHR